MKEYKQLSYEERERICLLKQSGLSIDQIGQEMGRSRATIWRELKRNQAPPGQYWPDTAQNLSLRRRQRSCLLETNDALREFVITKLCCHYWTPEQIAGWLKHRQNDLPSLCHESIYAWIYSKVGKKEKLWKFLPRHKVKRGLRKSKGAGVSRIPNRVSIHQRPEEAANRNYFGHWEADLMGFCKNTQHALVAREKKTMFTLSARLLSKKALETSTALIDFMKGLPLLARLTMTFDNGGEFANHERLSQALGILCFFCDPYASWQKGGVENTNGRLRRDLPRNTNLHTMTQEEFDETIWNYNTTPRKSLKWLTPLEAFNRNLDRKSVV